MPRMVRSLSYFDEANTNCLLLLFLLFDVGLGFFFLLLLNLGCFLCFRTTSATRQCDVGLLGVLKCGLELGSI